MLCIALRRALALVLEDGNGLFCALLSTLYCSDSNRIVGFVVLYRLRSGPPLMPECWAMIQGYEELFNYLRATRLRQEVKSLPTSSASSTCRPISAMELVCFVSTAHVCMYVCMLVTVFLTVLQTSSNALDSEGAVPERDRSLMLGMKAGNSSTSTSTSSLGSFCICGQGFVGKMIACEKAGCSIEWFHFQCVGLTQEVCVRSL